MYASNQYYEAGAPKEEADEYHRIIKEAIDRKLGYGTVRSYFLDPDGHVIHTQGVVYSLQNDNLKKILTVLAQDRKVQPGPPVFPPRAQSAPPPSGRDSLVLHVTARGAREGSWREFPAENWIVLTAEEWKKLLPSGPTEAGTTWDLDSAVARKMLTTFYPQMEDADRKDRSQITEQSMKAKILSVENGMVHARVDASVTMGRSFFPGHANLTPIHATVVGYMDFPANRQHVNALSMVTWKAQAGDEDFGVALRSGYERNAGK